MSASSPAMQRERGKRDRELITPEGLSMPLTIASRGARAGALLLDLTFICLGFVLIGLALLLLGISLADVESDNLGPMGEFFTILIIMLLFLSRYGYFLYFELGARAATPGKRLLGMRVAARDGGRLTAEMVIARNLLRDIEVFVPTFFMLSGGQGAGVVGIAAFVWLAIFVVFPFFNRDALRAGDIIAGTWVVEARSAKLQGAMSLAPDRSHVYRFGAEELSIYGEHELQVLEGVLRQGNDTAMLEVAQAICRKIGWDMGAGDQREFLEEFYAALRGHLESGMRFGKRKKNKFA